MRLHPIPRRSGYQRRCRICTGVPLGPFAVVALKRLQTDRKINADGEFDRKTRGMLCRVLNRQTEAAQKQAASAAKKPTSKARAKPKKAKASK
jgi:hypothetical protein